MMWHCQLFLTYVLSRLSGSTTIAPHPPQVGAGAGKGSQSSGSFVHNPWTRQSRDKPGGGKSGKRTRRFLSPAPSVTFSENQSEEEDSKEPLNVLPALLDLARGHYRFSKGRELPKDTPKAERNICINKRWAELKTLSATICMNEESGDAAEEERERDSDSRSS